MPKLVIVRHGCAVPGQDNDADRALTPQGVAEAEAAGQWLATRFHGAATVLCSPYLRARQTAELISKAGTGPVEVDQNITPSGDPYAVVERLTSRQSDVVLVSHLPLVGRVASLLTEGRLFDQPWSTAECWMLDGEVFAAGCMSVSQVWYPALEQTGS